MLCSSDLGAGRAINAPLFHRSALAVAAVGALGFSSPALADSGQVSVQWLTEPLIAVEANGSVYTKIASSAQPIAGGLFIELDAEASGRIKSWSAWPKIGLEPDSPQAQPNWVHFQSLGGSASYSVPRPKEIETLQNFVIEKTGYGEFMVGACNQHADKLRDQGLSNSQIFGEDRQLQVAVDGALEYEMTGFPGNHLAPEITPWPVYEKVDVICQAAEDLSPVAPDITAATLGAVTQQTSNATGACVLQLTGMIISKEPDTQIKFRYVDDSGQQSDVRTVTTDDGSDVSFLHSYPLDLKEKTSGKIQMVGASHAFKSNWADYQVDCERPADELVSALPPKAASLILAAEGEALHGNLVCPARVTLIGKLEGRGTASGTAFLAADGQLNAQKAYSIEDGETFHIKGEYDLDWDSVDGSQQSLPFALYATNANGEQVSALTRSKAFVCRPVQTMGIAQGAAGGVTTGTEQPLPSQSAAGGQFARQPAGAVVIMAPRGNVTSGRIQLSGGKPNANYALRFYRKTGSGYQQVRSARLPKQMTGAAASFDLKALTGGRNWRLQVCPAVQKDGATCETSDFGLLLIEGAGKVKAPGAATGTKVFTMPGSGN